MGYIISPLRGCGQVHILPSTGNSNPNASLQKVVLILVHFQVCLALCRVVKTDPPTLIRTVKQHFIVQDTLADTTKVGLAGLEPAT